MFLDNDLILLMKQGDSKAFTEIYDRYWNVLYNKAYQRIHNKEQAQDIVQNIFTDLWNRRECLKIENLQAYLHTAVRYQVFKLIERKPQSYFIEHFEELIVSPVHTDDLLLEKEVQNIIQLWIAALPSKRKEIFVQHYINNRSTKEIAQRLHVSTKTVQNQLHTASQSLRLRIAHFLSLCMFIAVLLK